MIASYRSRSRSPPSKRSRQASGYVGRRRSSSSSLSPEVQRRRSAADTSRQRQRPDRRSPAPPRRPRTQSPGGQRRVVSPAKHRSPTKQVNPHNHFHIWVCRVCACSCGLLQKNMPSKKRLVAKALAASSVTTASSVWFFLFQQRFSHRFKADTW